MREILFRGKRLDSGEWVEGGYKHEKVGEYYTAVFISEHLTSGVWGCHRVAPATVGQYTGLNDKNGNKIFEGDIVSFKTTAYTFQQCYVRWHEKTAQFVVTEKNFIRTYPMDAGWEYEVIGNIHDNPELLEGGSHE